MFLIIYQRVIYELENFVMYRDVLYMIRGNLYVDLNSR